MPRSLSRGVGAVLAHLPVTPVQSVLLPCGLRLDRALCAGTSFRCVARGLAAPDACALGALLCSSGTEFETVDLSGNALVAPPADGASDDEEDGGEVEGTVAGRAEDAAAAAALARALRHGQATTWRFSACRLGPRSLATLSTALGQRDRAVLRLDLSRNAIALCTGGTAEVNT